MTSDERIARARAAILACLLPGDQFDAELIARFSHPEDIVFCVLTTSWSRGVTLSGEISGALPERMAPWTRLHALDGLACRIEIAVPTGAP